MFGATSPRRLMSVWCLAILLWGCGVVSLSAADAPPGESPVTALPAELADPAFEGFVTLSRIIAAGESGDVEQLTDVALLVAHGEDVLQRPRRGVNAATLLRVAVQAASEEGDKASLERLARGVDRLGPEELQPVLSAALQLVDAPRRLTMPPGLDPSEVTAESMVIYNALAKEIRKAQTFGRVGDLDDILATVPQLPLHPKQQDHLTKLADQALVALNASPQDRGTLAMLSSASRGTGVAGGPLLLVTGPASVVPGTPAQGVVVLKRAATSDVRVHLQGSALVDVPATVTVPQGRASVSFPFQVKAPGAKPVLTTGTSSIDALAGSSGSRTYRFALGSAARQP